MRECAAVLCFALLAFFGGSETSFAIDDECGPLKKIGYPIETACGSVYCDYENWSEAGSDCAGTYTHNLKFELYNYTDALTMDVSGYLMTGQAGDNTLTITAVGGSSPKWEDPDRFVSMLDEYGSTIAFRGGPSVGKLLLENLQFFGNITNNWANNGFGLLELSGSVTVSNSFIWLHSPENANFGQKGIAIKIVNDGTFDLGNVVIFGDRLNTSWYGYFDYAIRAGTYSGTINVRNMTLFGKGVLSGSDPNMVENYRAFTGGIYNQASFTLNVTNSYVGVYGPCAYNYQTSGGGNVCNGTYIPNYLYNGNPNTPSSKVSYAKAGKYDFVAPYSASQPDFHVSDTSSVVYGQGNVFFSSTPYDMEDNQRTDPYLDTGADELQ